ncbi:MAG: hypothetical protein MZW92_03395 [Comamonadaceae bacterium]|nr:hypothetical protein [Comamonadaceae bacterium]
MAEAYDTKVKAMSGWVVNPSGSPRQATMKEVISSSLAPDTLYMDVRMMLLVVPEVDVGSVVGFEWAEERTRPRSRTTSNSRASCPRSGPLYTLTLPPGWEPDFNWINWAAVRAEARNPQLPAATWRVSIEIADIPAIENEPYMPGGRGPGRTARRPAPSPPAPAVRSFAGWADMGAWYAGLERSPSAGPRRDGRRARPAELTGRGPGHTFARSGPGRVRPEGHPLRLHPDRNRRLSTPLRPRDVLANRYGDCKDKADAARGPARGRPASTPITSSSTPTRGVVSPGLAGLALRLQPRHPGRAPARRRPGGRPRQSRPPSPARAPARLRSDHADDAARSSALTTSRTTPALLVDGSGRRARAPPQPAARRQRSSTARAGSVLTRDGALSRQSSGRSAAAPTPTSSATRCWPRPSAEPAQVPGDLPGASPSALSRSRASSSRDLEDTRSRPRRHLSHHRLGLRQAGRRLPRHPAPRRRDRRPSTSPRPRRSRGAIPIDLADHRSWPATSSRSSCREDATRSRACPSRSTLDAGFAAYSEPDPEPSGRIGRLRARIPACRSAAPAPRGTIEALGFYLAPWTAEEQQSLLLKTGRLQEASDVHSSRPCRTRILRRLRPLRLPALIAASARARAGLRAPGRRSTPRGAGP